VKNGKSKTTLPLFLVAGRQWMNVPTPTLTSVPLIGVLEKSLTLQ
jgi:hypothetical protein